MSNSEFKDPQMILNRLITEGRTVDCEGIERQVTGTISLLEAEYLQQTIINNRFLTCLETGVAYGSSTIAICSALSELGRDGHSVKHYGVDPCQTTHYGGAAIAALRECGLEPIFELCEGPSHLVLPHLIEQELKVDFVFVDGMHTFDYTLLDLFYADKLLRPGGMICIHDLEMPSKKMACRYLLRYRKYVSLSSVTRPISRRMGAAAKALLQGDIGLSWRQFSTAESMACLKKIETFEPEWDYYAKI